MAPQAQPRGFPSRLPGGGLLLGVEVVDTSYFVNLLWDWR
jgi:hypothetical protein